MNKNKILKKCIKHLIKILIITSLFLIMPIIGLYVEDYGSFFGMLFIAGIPVLCLFLTLLESPYKKFRFRISQYKKINKECFECIYLNEINSYCKKTGKRFNVYIYSL
jgi:hypothetical protein